MRILDTGKSRLTKKIEIKRCSPCLRDYSTSSAALSGLNVPLERSIASWTSYLRQYSGNWQPSQLDNIILFSISRLEYFKHVFQVLHLLSDAWAILKLKKHWFITDTFDYLGDIIRPADLENAMHTSDAVPYLN